MHPHVCWRLTRARSTSAASGHFLLTQVASAGLAAADAKKRARAPVDHRLMASPDRARAAPNFAVCQMRIALCLKGVNAMRLSRWLRTHRARCDSPEQESKTTVLTRFVWRRGPPDPGVDRP